MRGVTGGSWSMRGQVEGDRGGEEGKMESAPFQILSDHLLRFEWMECDLN